MRRIWSSMAVAAVAVFVTAGNVVAQEDGGGAILDWIHKLSGPQFIGFGLNVYHEWAGIQLPDQGAGHHEPGIRLRLSAQYRTSISESGEVDPDSANITMLTIQPTLEVPVTRIPLEFGIGIAANRFGGDADAFWHLSVPVLAQFRLRSQGPLRPRIGAAIHIFPHFSATDFAPLNVTVQRDAAEAVFQFFVAIDRSFR